MNIETFINIALVVSVVIFIGTILFIKRLEILSFFNPNGYIEVEMLELDNTINNWIQPKNSELKFKFNEGYYNMFSQSIDGQKISSSIYRSGRLGKFYYLEGNEDPLDFRSGKITGNPQLTRRLEKIEFSKLFEEEKTPMQDFLEKYGIWIFMIIIVVVIYMITKNAQTPPPTTIQGGP